MLTDQKTLSANQFKPRTHNLSMLQDQLSPLLSLYVFFFSSFSSHIVSVRCLFVDLRGIFTGAEEMASPVRRGTLHGWKVGCLTTVIEQSVTWT